MAYVVVVDTRARFADRLGKAFAGYPEHEVRFERFTSPAALPDQLDGCVLVIGPGLAADDALAVAESVPCPSVLVTPAESISLVKAAMRAGVRDVLSPEEPAEEIAAAVVSAIEVAAAAREGHAKRRGARVVTVLGMKGGVGKSVVASNLAVGMARLGKRVVLLDLDLQFGDAAIMLQLKPERTIYDAIQSFDRLDADMLSAYLVRHSSGLEALLAPTAPEDAESVTGVRLGRVIELLRELADVVVIDTPPALNDTVLTALEESDEVYAVSGLEVPSVKSIRVALQKLEQLGFDTGKVRLVVNRADSKVGLEPDAVRKATGCAVAAEIPSDRLVPSSVNAGVPIVLDKPKSAVARALLGLAADVASRCRSRGRRGRKGSGVSADVA